MESLQLTRRATVIYIIDVYHKGNIAGRHPLKAVAVFRPHPNGPLPEIPDSGHY